MSSSSPTIKHSSSQSKSLKIISGVLHWLWESPSSDLVVPQIVLLKKMRKEVFAQLHNTPTAGLWGVNKTSDRIRERFCWPHCLERLVPISVHLAEAPQESQCSSIMLEHHSKESHLMSLVLRQHRKQGTSTCC